MKAEMTLDFNELYVFMLYVFMCLFEVRISREQAEALFSLMDSTARGEVNYGELVMVSYHRSIREREGGGGSGSSREVG